MFILKSVKITIISLVFFSAALSIVLVVYSYYPQDFFSQGSNLEKYQRQMKLSSIAKVITMLEKNIADIGNNRSEQFQKGKVLLSRQSEFGFYTKIPFVNAYDPILKDFYLAQNKAQAADVLKSLNVNYIYASGYSEAIMQNTMTMEIINDPGYAQLLIDENAYRIYKIDHEGKKEFSKDKIFQEEKTCLKNIVFNKLPNAGATINKNRITLSSSAYSRNFYLSASIKGRGAIDFYAHIRDSQGKYYYTLVKSFLLYDTKRKTINSQFMLPHGTVSFGMQAKSISVELKKLDIYHINYPKYNDRLQKLSNTWDIWPVNNHEYLDVSDSFSYIRYISNKARKLNHVFYDKLHANKMNFSQILLVSEDGSDFYRAHTLDNMFYVASMPIDLSRFKFDLNNELFVRFSARGNCCLEIYVLNLNNFKSQLVHKEYLSENWKDIGLHIALGPIFKKSSVLKIYNEILKPVKIYYSTFSFIIKVKTFNSSKLCALDFKPLVFSQKPVII